jgi:uncharacterized protein (TIGR00661 family)
MARIIYALSGQGRGHASRVMAISSGLRARGHDVTFCCGGTAHEVLSSLGGDVLEVPAMRHFADGNRVTIVGTIRMNESLIRGAGRIVDLLAAELVERDPDLLISDFEAFSPRAAARIGLPVLALNHQQIVTETSYRVPAAHWLSAATASLAVRLIAPRRPRHVLVPSFFFPRVKDPRRATLIPPIIRPAVQTAEPAAGDHVLVYYNGGHCADDFLEQLSRVDAPFVLYHAGGRPSAPNYPNLTFKEPCLDEFLEDLVSCRAVVCTAGFTLISEALYLGKPLLVIPTRGQFEQTLNAIFLRDDGLGEAVIDRPLRADDIVRFLQRIHRYAVRRDGPGHVGNEQALDLIEAFCGGGKRLHYHRVDGRNVGSISADEVLRVTPPAGEWKHPLPTHRSPRHRVPHG